MNESILYG